VKSSNQDRRRAQANGPTQEEQTGSIPSGTKVLTGPVDSDRKQLFDTDGERLKETREEYEAVEAEATSDHS
jgi:hypothetical protein